MSPKDSQNPSSYGPSNEAARARVETSGDAPRSVKEIAYIFDREVTTVYSEWINKAWQIKDPQRRFPEATWPDGPLWAESVLREWAEYTNRKMRPLPKAAKRTPRRTTDTP
jgi:hypothetical protein